MVNATMRVRVMTNPAQLLLAGNPSKSRKNRKKPVKEHTVAKRRKSKKSPVAKAKRAASRKQKRANRKKAQPAGLRKYWAKKRAAKAVRRPAKKRKSRPSKKSRMKKSRARRSRKNRVKNVYASPGARVVVRKVRRGSARKPSRVQRRRARRVGVVGVNAGAMTLTGGITGFMGNVKATMKDGVKGFAFAFGGAAVSVAGGAFMSRITSQVVSRVAPTMLSNPIVSRLLGAVNYYLPGWAASKFVPGLSGKSRRAMLTGAAAAALIEVIRPGMIRDVMVRVPVVGGLMGVAEDQADGVGAYVAYALSGDSRSNQYPYTGDEDNSMGQYVEVNGDAAQDMGVADYVGISGMGEYVAY